MYNPSPITIGVYTSRQEVNVLKTLISFRLRKYLDADLIDLEIDEDDLPELCRNGLRLMLGIRTTREMEVREKPLNIPAIASASPISAEQKEKAAQSPSRAAAGPLVLSKQRSN
jgi:hypothetical protein